ncbi:MAG: hypothetical protein HRU20_17245 [Pseudomonadales bacterium]|nr:hypothetical protein [Pseudomonadales bacterium]
MKVKTVIMVCISICLCFSFSSYAAGKAGGKILVLNLVGSGEMYLGKVPAIGEGEEEDDAICFDVDLVNAKNGQKIGTATDCLSEVSDGDMGGKALVGTSYFYMHQGMLITRGRTTVQPTNHDIVTTSGQMITHITGAAGTDNAIIGGTGRFAGRTGTVRLSGLVDMSAFDGNVGDPIAFDCLFVITLD